MDHVEQGEMCLERLRQVNGIRQSLLGMGTKIERDEHVLDRHERLLLGSDAPGRWNN
jgi:hypothetical protein